MEFQHRIVILGDPHINPAERPLWEREIVPDINALDPGLVLVMGDLTGGHDCGSAHATREAVETLSGLRAPWASIIGNHDLQSTDFESDEAAVAMMQQALGREQPGFVIERQAFAVIGLGNTFWRRNPVNKNEIVIDDAQIAWWEGELERLAPKPIVIICHAPPIGSGVLVMPELHARVGNAYVNQSAVPGKIQEVIWKHPNILFWFSGHTHLGQHYRDAISQQLGVVYAHTGTASRTSARDGHRHSRILEIGDGGYRIRTFDHGLRAVDCDLDFTVSEPLSTLVENRRRFLGSRFVPRDPSTMAQPSAAALRKPEKRRYLFLSDAHSTAPLSPIQARVAEWCRRQACEVMPDAVLLGGDLTHRAIPAQAEAFLETLGLRGFPLHYLPGNNEGSGFAYPKGVEPVTECTRLEERLWLLPTANTHEAQAAVDALLSQLPKEGSCLVFAHFPPFLAGEDRLKQLEEAPVRIHWICGHRHEAQESASGNLFVRICAGLDPIKVRRSLPELLVIDWDGVSPEVRRVALPAKFLNPPRPVLHRAGLAFRGSGETLLKLALERKIPAIQFHYRYSFGPPSACERALAREYREKLSGGFLSLHLPNFPHPEAGPNLADQEASLQFAEGIGMDDLTVHLPNVKSSTLFTEDGSIQPTDWAENCLQTYTALSARALAMGAQISFENVYNKKVAAPGEERLASRPWHLLRFVEAVRARLREAGVSPEATERVGIIFDAGHAFADVQMTKHYGLADWLAQVAPYLQLSHIHQVTPNPDGPGTVNHRPISALAGPLINFHGLLAAFRDVSLRPFPLLIEVRDQEEALVSYATLVESGLLENECNR